MNEVGTVGRATRSWVAPFVIVLVTLLAAASLSVARAPAAGAAGRSLHVQPTGTGGGDGSEADPFGKIQNAANAALPGDTLLLHTGTYDEGTIRILNSGAADAPITIQPAGDGPVTVRATHPAPPLGCDEKGPTGDRTLKIMQGADYWTVRGLRIEGGLWVSGNNFGIAKDWLSDQFRADLWKARRALPGRGRDDRVAAENIYTALEAKIGGVPLDPSEGVRILDNEITGRGVHAALTRRGELGNNHIHDIECGTGPGSWITAYSDFWHIHHNFVHHVEGSTRVHFMQEGLRLGGASNYNLIEYNLVEDLPGMGKAITTDVDPSFNTFRFNTARRVDVAFNDQMSGWGNKWVYNRGEQARTAGLVFRGADASLPQPDMNTSTRWAEVRCNVIRETHTGMAIGAIKESKFLNNDFGGGRIRLGQYVPSYWVERANLWNTKPVLPPEYPPPPRAGSCRLLSSGGP